MQLAEEGLHAVADYSDVEVRYAGLLLLGDFAKARERNDELLWRWKNADPDVPLLAEAKALAPASDSVVLGVATQAL